MKRKEKRVSCVVEGLKKFILYSNGPIPNVTDDNIMILSLLVST